LSFSNFNLQKDFISSIEEAGYTEPTPLQTELIPLVADKKNVLIWTQSASGKTGAFLIPAMNYILENPNPEKRGARVLILTSRRDRVSQINYTIKRLSSNHTMRFGFVVSGRPYQTQMRLMRRPLDIMIATPGRLNDLMNNGKADFSQLEMLIIDDLTSIYKKNLQGLVEKIIQQAGSSCSTIAFAHDDQHVTSYAKELLSDAIELNFENEPSEKQTPKHSHKPQSPEPQEQQALAPEKHEKVVKQKSKPEPIQVDINELMPQKVHVADDYTHKIAMMDHLMDEYAGEKTLIYTSTGKVAKTLLENLSNHGHAAEMLHELSSDEADDSEILIYSDQDKAQLTAKIMEDSDLNIIHFDLPRKTDQYLKRLQNHASVKEKESLLMVDGYDFNALKHLEKTFGETLEQITVPGLEPLNPFVNQSKRRSSNQSQQTKSKQRPNQKSSRNSNPRNKNNSRNARNKNPRNARNNNNQNKDNQSNDNQNNSNGKQQTRQRKGPFGRTNGGGRANTGRKNGAANNNNRNRKTTVGVSRRGTQAPNNDRAWESDFAEPQERKVESKSVVISYKKRSFTMEKPDSDDA